MLKKSYTFGLLAAVALIIAPTTAFAGQAAVSTQEQSQSSVVYGEGNTVVQQGSQLNRQTQSTRNNRGRYTRYTCRGRLSPQTAVATQSQSQSSVVSGYDNTVAQQGNQRSSQRQSYSCR